MSSSPIPIGPSLPPAPADIAAPSLSPISTRQIFESFAEQLLAKIDARFDRFEVKLMRVLSKIDDRFSRFDDALTQQRQQADDQDAVATTNFIAMNAKIGAVVDETNSRVNEIEAQGCPKTVAINQMNARFEVISPSQQEDQVNVDSLNNDICRSQLALTSPILANTISPAEVGTFVCAYASEVTLDLVLNVREVSASSQAYALDEDKQRANADVDADVPTFALPVLVHSSFLRAGSLLRSDSLAAQLQLMASKTRDDLVWEDFLANLPPPAPNINGRRSVLIIFGVHVTKNCVRLNAYATWIKANDVGLSLQKHPKIQMPVCAAAQLFSCILMPPTRECTFMPPPDDGLILGQEDSQRIRRANYVDDGVVVKNTLRSSKVQANIAVSLLPPMLPSVDVPMLNPSFEIRKTPRKPPFELNLLILAPVCSIPCPRVQIACDLQIFSSTFTDEAVAQLFSCIFMPPTRECTFMPPPDDGLILGQEDSQRIRRENDVDDGVVVKNTLRSSEVQANIAVSLIPPMLPSVHVPMLNPLKFSAQAASVRPLRKPPFYFKLLRFIPF